nr:subtilisin-like protease sbt4.8 [Quercus suber]
MLLFKKFEWCEDEILYIVNAGTVQAYGSLTNTVLMEHNNLAIHHYSKSFRGFSAMLTPEQAQQLADKDLVVSVFQSKMNMFHTTHSWEFLGTDSAQQYNQMPMESTSNTIVGVIDKGIWPESKSFNDKGLGPVPKKFKGECVTGEHFRLANCNRKIIGVRFYLKGFEEESGPLESFNLPFLRSARDGDGHGTHTASTIAGSIVANVRLFGMARGTARGGAPSARLAIYKACWFDMCSEADIHSALDDAISDGVDILSISIGPDPHQPSHFENAILIGAFHAFQRGILASASAGNSAFPGTATNVAPWILTVAASSVDREFHSIVYLGNSKVLKGFSLNPIKMETYYGLIAGSVAAAPGVTAKNARNPVGKISPTITVLNIKPAPEMVVFSSMGPNIITPDIIKPNITGPGLNILAAWSPVVTTATAEQSVDYNIISSASLSCPHVSAVAAIVKSYQPSWSPAAIMSAIMTTGKLFYTIMSDNYKFTYVFDWTKSMDYHSNGPR